MARNGMSLHATPESCFSNLHKEMHFQILFLLFAQVLVNERTLDTTALLMQLCTKGDASSPDADYVAEVSDFAALFSYRRAAHLLKLHATLCFSQKSCGSPANIAHWQSAHMFCVTLPSLPRAADEPCACRLPSLILLCDFTLTETLPRRPLACQTSHAHAGRSR